MEKPVIPAVGSVGEIFLPQKYRQIRSDNSGKSLPGKVSSKSTCKYFQFHTCSALRKSGFPPPENPGASKSYL
jgi:hypothetical protein